MAVLPLLLTTACGANWFATPAAATPQSSATPAQQEPLPLAEIIFQVEVPGNTPEDSTIFLSVLDEVTGLAINGSNYAMQPAGTEGLPNVSPVTPGNRVYGVKLPLAMGSAIKYRYERQTGDVRVAEHVSDGTPVRYRVFHVEGPGSVEDVISRWTDTPYTSATGRIMGQATDAETGQPVPNLLVTAGGAQTLTTSDGSYLLEGLPPGIHNLVGLAMDGSYRTFQQGARVAPDSTTPAPLKLHAAPLINVVFAVRLPEGTPPLVPVRMAGSLYQLGNTFATLAGGMSSLPENMPVLTALPDGRYTVTLTLPAGADITYKYTLGDGFWNAEHTQDGAFRLRQLVVPENNVLIEDTVDNWGVSANAPITFDVRVPPETPPGDIVYIQFNPLFGWTVPIPMWHLGENRWAYILYSPLNLPGSLSYRYCLNGQCGEADDIETPGIYGAGRPVNVGPEPQMLKDEVKGWVGIGGETVPANPPAAAVTPRGADFVAGVEFRPSFHPSWTSLFPSAVQAVKGLGANWLVFSPTWTYRSAVTETIPPVLEPIPGQDALWPDDVAALKAAGSQAFKVAVHPTANFPMRLDDWWLSAPRDFPWWQVWFEHYRTFAIHYADLAARNGASALILGDDWVTPALPQGVLMDGSPSGVPSDAEQRWREIIDAVRQHYSGTLLWALPSTSVQSPPPFLDAVDGVYLEWTPIQGQPLPPTEADISQELDTTILPLQQQVNRPFILAVNYPADDDLQGQAQAYNSLLSAVDSRPWLSGFVSQGYYPPTVLQDKTASVRGKPAEEVLKYWYDGFLGSTP